MLFAIGKQNHWRPMVQCHHSVMCCVLWLSTCRGVVLLVEKAALSATLSVSWATESSMLSSKIESWITQTDHTMCVCVCVNVCCIFLLAFSVRCSGLTRLHCRGGINHHSTKNKRLDLPRNRWHSRCRKERIRTDITRGIKCYCSYEIPHLNY